jgi:hypothetical protein
MSFIDDALFAKVLGSKQQELFKRLQPGKSDDAWKAIPWMTNIMAARKRSAKEKLPILMWIMVGNPQGCT